MTHPIKYSIQSIHNINAMGIAKILLPMFTGLHTFYIISNIHYIHVHSLGVNMRILLNMKYL